MHWTGFKVTTQVGTRGTKAQKAKKAQKAQRKMKTTPCLCPYYPDELGFENG